MDVLYEENEEIKGGEDGIIIGDDKKKNKDPTSTEQASTEHTSTEATSTEHTSAEHTDVASVDVCSVDVAFVDVCFLMIYIYIYCMELIEVLFCFVCRNNNNGFCDIYI